MTVKARLTNQGELLLSGNIDTRLPLVTDGLVAHYPMDGTAKGIGNNNILDYSTWTIGTSGTQTGFNAVGATGSQTIIKGTDPFGAEVAVWNAQDPDVASDGDGGFTTSTLPPLVVTNMYRVSVWQKCIVEGDAHHYFRMRAASTDMQKNDTSSTTGQLWPTWQSTSDSWFDSDRLDEWFLFVGHIWPNGNTDYGDHEDSGIWDTAGNKVQNLSGYDFRFGATIGDCRVDVIQYYDVTGTHHQQMAYPRIDVIDGSEPTLQDLFQSEGNIINPLTDVDTTKTNDGVAVETGTTNVIPDGDFTDGLKLPYSAATRGVVSIVTDSAADKKILKFTNTGGGHAYLNGTHTVLSTAASGETWTGSVWARTDSITDVTARMYVLGRDASTYIDYGYVDIAINVEDGWVKLVNTRTFTNAAVTNIACRLDCPSDLATVYYSDWQVEKLPNSTEFVNGTRATTPKLTLNNPVKTGECTFNYKVKIGTNIGTAASYQTTFCVGNYYSTSSFTIMDYNETSEVGRQRLIRKSDADAWGWLGADLTTAANFQDYNVITIVKNATNYRGYSNGVYIGQLAHGTVTLQDYVHIGNRGGWRAGGNCTIKDVSFYDRALSDDEVKLLAKGTHKFTLTDTIANSIQTENKLVGKHFPLGADGKDFYKDIEPTTDTNCVYEGDGAWLGKQTTNIYTSPTDMTNAAWVYYQLTIDAVDDYWRLIENTATTVAHYIVQSKSYSTGLTYTISCEIKADPLSENRYMSLHLRTEIIGAYVSVTFDPKDGSVTQNTLGTAHSEYIGGGWYRVSVSAAVTINYTGTNGGWFRMADEATKTSTHASYTGDGASGMFIRKPQIEYTGMPTPFVDGTRADSRLHLPYDVIDLKEDFTIYGWMKPMVLDLSYQALVTRNPTNSNSNYNRFLFMTGTGTHNKMACWFGSDGVAESFLAAPNIDLIVGEWTFACCKRDGLNISIHVGNSGGYATVSTPVATRLDLDETGQVWHVGQFNTTESQSYHRDLVFKQSAISDDDIEAIFKTKMRAYADRLVIQNGITTGCTF